MNRKIVSLVAWVTFLIGISVQAIVSAEISVGVEAGDRIEYDFVWKGTPDSSPYLAGYKIEILGVQGTTVTLNGTLIYSDGTQETVTKNVNLQTGELAAGFIIPANLEDGDSFYDNSYGFITVRAERRDYVGASRVVVWAHLSSDGVEATVYWDQATGVLVEQDGLEVNIKASETNMWEAEFWLPIDPTLFFILIIVAVVIVTAVAFSMIRRQKKTKPKKSRKKTRKRTL